MSSMICPHCKKPLDIRLTVGGTPTPSEKAAVDADTTDVGDLLESIVDSALNDWEKKFVADLRGRYEKYGDKIKMSEKQLSTLRKIAAGDAGDDWK